MLEAVIFVVFPLCMAMAAMTDMLSMTIPNRVSLLLAGTFFVIAPFAGLDLITFGWHLLAAFLVLAVCFTLFAINVMGGGDAKILAASALWFGFNIELLNYMTLVAYFGGALTIIIVVLRNQYASSPLADILPLPAHFKDRTAGVPYGIAIGAAALISYPNTDIFIRSFA